MPNNHTYPVNHISEDDIDELAAIAEFEEDQRYLYGLDFDTFEEEIDTSLNLAPESAQRFYA